jgi:uncharacterized phage infection (PIP) family protein YhgE
MSNENWLIYPTVDLFVYDLADGIGQNDEKISQNHQQFWKKIYGDKISESLLEKLKQAEDKIGDDIDLLGAEQVVKFDSPLEGYAYPVKLGDTYSVQFDLSPKIETDEDNQVLSKPIDCLEELKKELISRVNPPATIGQSWLVWGQLTSDNQDALETAKNCYSKLNLFPKANWDTDFQIAGQFLGADFDADFYELWLRPGDSGEISQNYHVLICLFPNNRTQSIDDINHIVVQLYAHLRRLFAFRNKVIWAYTQSRQLKADLRDAARSIQDIVKQLPEQVNTTKVDLKELQQILVKCLTFFSDYAVRVSRLEDQENTIKTNIKNYKRRLETIGKEMGSDAEAFQFMASFSDFAKEKYVWQVAADNRSLTAGLRLLENAIQTIEGIIEIERAKSDRTLNVTLGAVGVGIATSGVYASVYAGQIKPAQNLDVNTVFWSSIGWGFIAGALGAIFLIIIGKKWR